MEFGRREEVKDEVGKVGDEEMEVDLNEREKES